MYHIRFTIGDVNVITATNPVFASLLGRVFLKERFGVFEAVNLLFAMSGIVLVIQPPFIFDNLGDGDAAQNFTAAYYVPAALCIVSAFFSALNVVLTRAMKNLDVFLVSAWIGFFGFFPPMIFSLATGRTELPPVGDVPFVLIIALLSYCAMNFNTMALKVTDDPARS